MQSVKLNMLSSDVRIPTITYVVMAKSKSCTQKNGSRCIGLPFSAPVIMNMVMAIMQRHAMTPMSMFSVG